VDHFPKQVAPELPDQIKIQIFFDGTHHLVADYKNLDDQDGHCLTYNLHMYLSQVKDREVAWEQRH